MKIDRLIGILSVLLQRTQVTAPELAKQFEVSRRTINRDIEALCRAGIPIATMQGTGGGIRIMEGYRIDRTLLTSKDMQIILAGLRSLDSVSGSNYYSRLMEKLKVGSSHFISGQDSILIDLSSWYKDMLAPKIETILLAVEQKHLLSFRYYSPNGESSRTVEPYYLIFKWSSWYLWGYCRKRMDFRMFKLNRMDQLETGQQSFQARPAPMPDMSNERIFPGKIKAKVLFEPQVKWRLVEEFGPHCFEKQPDGRLLFTADYTNKWNLANWLLTFGAAAEILEPASMREELLQIGRHLAKIYGDGK